MNDDTYITRTGILRVRDDGILHASVLPGSVVTLDDARASFASIPPRPDGGKQLLLVDFRHMKGMTREARAFYASDEPARTLAATAILVASPLSRVLGTFFLGLNRTSMPTRLFTSEQEAISWLKEQTT